MTMRGWITCNTSRCSATRCACRQASISITSHRCFLLPRYWLPTDLFYTTQEQSGGTELQPHYQVGRIPLPAFPANYGSVDQRVPAQTYLPDTPCMDKLQQYAALLNSDAENKNTAYNNWFGRAAVVAGLTNYWNWYQFFSGYAQYLLRQQFDTGGGVMGRFSGLLVKKIDIFGKNQEQLAPNNVLRHLSMEYASAPNLHLPASFTSSATVWETRPLSFFRRCRPSPRVNSTS